jgi:hypothetical protein
MKTVSIANALLKKKIKNFKHEDHVLNEAYKILNRDLFHEKKILQNLKLYNRSFEMLDEEEVDDLDLFSASTIKEIAVQYRLKFLDSQQYKKEIPYEAILKIKDLNARYRKDIKHFKILAPVENFRTNGKDEALILFAPTNHGNYYMIHQWGNDLKWYRKLSAWPMKRFETLFATVALISLMLAVSLPTRLIWLPEHSDYWGTYRIGAFFHILIFNMGVTAYITFAFGKNFSSNTWNQVQDFH